MTEQKKVGDFYALTWLIFAGLVTILCWFLGGISCG